jgi:hypothetical protein
LRDFSIKSLPYIVAKLADTGQVHLEMVLKRCIYCILLICKSSHVKKIVKILGVAPIKPDTVIELNKT